METPPVEPTPDAAQRCIDASELALLQQTQTERTKRLTDLGAITRQIRALEAQRDQIDGELDHLDREHAAFSNRLTKKYNLGPNVRIDLGTGAIS